MSELDKYINPNSIGPKTPYIGALNLKPEVLGYIREYLEEDFRDIHMLLQNKLDIAEFTTYNNLYQYKVRGLFKPGQLYAITDYNTLVNQSGIFSLHALLTEVAPLEIHNILIVEAISANELSENAKLLRWFEPVDGAWTPELGERFGHLSEIQEIDVKYDPYWDCNNETAFEKSKVNWVPKFAYDSNTKEAQGVFYTHVMMDAPISICPIILKQFLNYTGVNFYGQIGENGTTQRFWEFASGDVKYYLQSDTLRRPISGETAYIITKLSTEVGQNNILGSSGYYFNATTFTGYIYHAKDKWGNESPYDFGCILKDASWIHDVPHNISYFSPEETVSVIATYLENTVTTPFMSALAWHDLPAIFTPFYYQGSWKNNVIKEVNTSLPEGLKIEIDFNFIHIAAPEFLCADNYIGINSNQVILTGSNIENNTVGGGANIFMLDPTYNKIGYCKSIVTIAGYNTIGNVSSFISLYGDHNIISDGCSHIVMRKSYFNKVGYNCEHITFGNHCVENIIEDACLNITFGDNYSRNTIHTGSSNISFRNSNSINAGILNNVRFCNIGKNCTGTVLYYPAPMGDNDFVQNIEVEDGIKLYQVNEYKFVEIPALNNEYKIRVGNNSQGDTKVWNAADYANTFYGECNVSPSTVAKTVTTLNGGFVLKKGAKVSVKFLQGHTASTMTLNVDGSGAKNVYRNGNSPTTNMIVAYNVYEFVYDGTYWRIIGVDTNTTYSVATSTYSGLMNKSDKIKLDTYPDTYEDVITYINEVIADLSEEVSGLRTRIEELNNLIETNTQS